MAKNLLEETKNLLKGAVKGSVNFLKDKNNRRYGAALLADIGNSYIDYSLFDVENDNLKLQASQIELQAQQEINQLREQFNNSIGNYQSNTAAKGLKYGGDGLEISAKNLGEDINTLETNAAFKTNALKTQYGINKNLNKTTLFTNIGNSLIDFTENYKNNNGHKGGK